jgi:RNA polymerase sigma-70 factor (ECF subfamily)
VDSDEVLAVRAAAGDPAAFEALVLRYQSRVYRLVRILAGNLPEAEDLTQETFIRAYRAIGRFRRDSTFRTWLHRIAVNATWSHLARRRHGISLVALESDADGNMAVTDVAACDDDPETALIRRQAIDRALATLSTEARLVITLRDIQGLEYQEIATITGVPIGTVESRLFRARRRLRPLLEPLRTPPA